MAFTQHESRGESVGSFPSIPRTPPRSSGFRTKWHTLSSSARGLLCFHPPDHAYENHWPSDNKVALHTPSRSKSAMSQPSSRDITTPWNVVRGRSCQVHTEKVAKYEARETIWDDKITTTTTTTTKLSSPGSKPSSEAAASVNAPLIEQSSARRPPLYGDHMAPPLHFNMTQTRAEGGEDRIATGDTIEALIDAILQIGDSEEWDSVASFGTSSLGTEAAIDDKSMVCGVGEEKTKPKNDSAGAREDADADERRAWEDMKRRVIHIEEFGALPLPLDGASAGDSERTSREFRARRRRSWAEKAIRGPAREETSRRALSTKKRRRHAGCWDREDGVFMRLYARRM